MSKVLTGVDSYSNTFTIPTVGEPVSQATSESPLQQLIDNTFHLDARLDTAESSITTNTTNIGTNTTNIALKADKTIDMIAGAGLTGGGTLAANRTFDVVANADGSIVVNANDVIVGVLATDAQHGVRGGGTQHPDATGSVAGFMSAADKNKLDGALGGASVSIDSGTSGTQDDFAPTGIDTADFLLHTNASGLTLTGLLAPTATGKRQKSFILDNAASSLQINDEDGSSSAANRIKRVSTAHNNTFDKDSGWILWYDDDSLRWRVSAEFGIIS